MTTASRLKSEYLNTDPELLCKIFPVPVSKGISAYSPVDSTTLVSFLQALSTGVISMSSDIPGLAQTSANLALVRMISDDIEVVLSSRSSIPEELLTEVESIANIASSSNVNCDLELAYES
jgi:di/tripeptidase